MNELGKILGDAFLDAIRQAVREEIQAASNGNGHHEGGNLLDVDGAAERWNIPKSWISEMASAPLRFGFARAAAY